MSKNLAYKILIFSAIILILDRGLGFVVSHLSAKYKFDKRIENLINNRIEKDIIVLGSSKSLNGIDPKIIEKETELSCYNLSYSGSNVEFHETILDLILQSKQLPKYIIYSIDDPGLLVKFDGVMIYRTEELYANVDNHYINKIVCDKLDKSFLVTKFSSVYHQNVNLTSALKYVLRGEEKPDYEINNIDEYGANIMDGHQRGHENMKFVNRNFNYSASIENSNYVNTFRRILQKCESANIRLKLVVIPSFVSPSLGFINRVNELTKNEYPIYDYSKEFKEAHYFYNYEHLNRKGASKFSTLLLKDLKL